VQHLGGLADDLQLQERGGARIGGDKSLLTSVTSGGVSSVHTLQLDAEQQHPAIALGGSCVVGKHQEKNRIATLCLGVCKMSLVAPGCLYKENRDPCPHEKETIAGERSRQPCVQRTLSCGMSSQRLNALINKARISFPGFWITYSYGSSNTCSSWDSEWTSNERRTEIVCRIQC
jgi:hypothetical protein